MQITDLIIGILLANSLPHFIFGITKTRFLGLFGYSPKGNIIYAILQTIAGIIVFILKYGFFEIFTNGFILGFLIVISVFFVFGIILVKIYKGKERLFK